MRVVGHQPVGMVPDVLDGGRGGHNTGVANDVVVENKTTARRIGRGEVFIKDGEEL